jgi:hypothetical protein
MMVFEGLGFGEVEVVGVVGVIGVGWCLSERRESLGADNQLRKKAKIAFDVGLTLLRLD